MTVFGFDGARREEPRAGDLLASVPSPISSVIDLPVLSRRRKCDRPS